MVPIGTSQELKEKVHELMNRRNTIADRSTRLVRDRCKSCRSQRKITGLSRGREKGWGTVSEGRTNYEGYIDEQE